MNRRAAFVNKALFLMLHTPATSIRLACIYINEMNGVLGPHLCTYRLNLARITCWRWWDEWEDTALQTRDSKFVTWRSEAEHATSRSRRLPTILSHYEWAEKKHFVSLKIEGQSGIRTRDLRLSKQAALTTALGPPPRLHIPVKHVQEHQCLCIKHSDTFSKRKLKSNRLFETSCQKKTAKNYCWSI